MTPTDRSILRIAVPAIISNVTVPLLGMVDVAIVGHLGDAVYIGAIAVGGMLFNVVYWIFNFLRMGTGGMTSQALGARRLDETVRMLVRSLTVAMTLAVVLLLLQRPIRRVALWYMCGDDGGVASQAAAYYDICVWGAPAMLGLYSLTGWLIGMQNSRTPMVVAITQNVVNIVASLLLVYGAGMKVEGVAAGTLIAQWTAFLLTAALIGVHYRNYIVGHAVLATVFARGALTRFFSVNRDIFLRTLCLVAVMSFFTSAGSWQGATVLAVNTLLMQLFLIFSYIMDGFAYAAEALSGKAYGAMLGNRGGATQETRRALDIVVRRLFLWGGAMVVLFTLLYIGGGRPFLRLLTDEPTVVGAAVDYLPWAVALPVVSCAAFIWDGVFIGCTMTRGMLLSMAAAATVFFVVYLSLSPWLGNHALWMAFLAYLAVRGAAQSVLFMRGWGGDRRD